jgi:hypothetical protein
MFQKFLVALFLVTASALVSAGTVPIKAPKQLLAQVQRLSELLRDSYAVLYPNATLVQLAKRTDGEELALVIFTIEGWGGGNMHTQYIAAFASDTNEKGQKHYMFIDAIPIGGKGWRGITSLDARIPQAPKGSEASIAFDAMEVSGDDAPNFPSKKVRINLLLKDGHLVEQKSPRN